MPFKDGIDLAKEIKQFCKNSDIKLIPIAMISAFDCDQDLKLAKEAGIEKFFKKPLKFDRFK